VPTLQDPVRFGGRGQREHVADDRPHHVRVQRRGQGPGALDTVKKQVSPILGKLGAVNRTEAAGTPAQPDPLNSRFLGCAI